MIKNTATVKIEQMMAVADQAQAVALAKDPGTLIVMNHSGGKDSQATFILLRELGIPLSRIVLAYADLGEIVWPGTKEHIKAFSYGLELQVVSNRKWTLLDKIADRKQWPSKDCRFCTSDFKRDQIARIINAEAKKRGAKVVLNVIGLRAQESKERANREPLEKNGRLTRKTRQVFNWHPLLAWSEKEVFTAIAEAGEKPHWAYAQGMSRLSCSFCIMSSKQDLKTAAKLRADLYARYCALEKFIGKSMMIPEKGEGPKWLPQITGIEPAAAAQEVA